MFKTKMGNAAPFPMALEFLPSLCWFTFMAAPSILTFSYLDVQTRQSQISAIGLFMALMCISDYISWRINRGKAETNEFSEKYPRSFNYLYITALAAFFIAPVVNIVAAGEMPIFDLLSSRDTVVLSAARENFSKLLEVPYILKVLFSQTLTVLAPVLFGIAVFRRRYWIAASIFFWAIFYAVVSLAKFPAILFLGTASALIASQIRRFRGPTFLTILLLISLALLSMTEFRIGRLEQWYSKATASDIIIPPQSAEFPFVLSPADLERISVKPEFVETTSDVPPTFGEKLDFLIYRSLLTPVDVSNRWYEYYSFVADSYRSPNELLRISRPTQWQHPSNVVGRWAFHSRFPTSYLESVHAYASIDADAYSFGGIVGVSIVAVGFSLVRILMAVWVEAESVGKTLYVSALFLLALLPPSASIQAILGAQGVATILIAMIAVKLSCRISVRDKAKKLENNVEFT